MAAEERVCGVRWCVAERCEGIVQRPALEGDGRLAVELVADRAEQLALDHDVQSLAEQLDVPGARSLEDVVPHGHQGCYGAAREVHPGCGDVLDARVTVNGPGRCRHCLDRTEPPPQDVYVMDGMLEHRSSSGTSGIDPPVRAVQTLDGKVLIVSEDHGEHTPRTLIGQEVPHEAGGTQEPQHQTDLIDDTCCRHGRDHLVDQRCRHGQWLLTEDRLAGRCDLVNESRVLARPRHDVDGVDGVYQVILSHNDRAVLRRERCGTIGVGIVHRDDPVLDRAAREEPDVEAADEAGAEEPDLDQRALPISRGARYTPPCPQPQWLTHVEPSVSTTTSDA